MSDSHIRCGKQPGMEWAQVICRAAVIVAVVLVACPTGAADIPFQYRIVDPEMGPGHCDILTVGDVNGDGKQDMIAALTQGPVFWFENPSLGRHQVWKEWMYWSCNGEVGDMDNDGDNDIVLTGWGNKKWYWLENTGKDGEWPRHVIGKGDLKPHDVEIADFDLDGDIDVVVRSESWGNSSKEIIVCRQEKSAWSQKSLFTPLEGGGLDTADTDGDGDADIIVPGHWFQNPGGDIIGKNWPLHVFDPKTHLYAKVETGDINGDGRADIVVTQSEVAGTPKEKSGPIAWYAGPPNPEKGPWPKHIIEENVRRHHSLAIADMDCDGDLDIFTAEMGGKSLKRAEIKVWINEDKAKKWTKQVLAITGSHEANVFDLGNDGDMDIFGLNYTTTKLELWENKTDPPATGSKSD